MPFFEWSPSLGPPKGRNHLTRTQSQSLRAHVRAEAVQRQDPEIAPEVLRVEAAQCEAHAEPCRQLSSWALPSCDI